jgi:cytochrome P450
MHRNPAYWGEDVLEFDPDRWIDDRLHKLTENPFAFLPFNGPCIDHHVQIKHLSFHYSLVP